MIAPAVVKRLFISGAAALLMLVGGASALLWTRHHLLDSIAGLTSTSESVSEVAADLRVQCVAQNTQASIAQQRKDIDDRLKDLQSPACVVSRLSESCRKHGATILEIAPIVPPPTATPRNPLTEGRRFRLVVRGSYRQIATLLDACPRLRLPARVVEFSVAPTEGANPGDQLTAMVVLESFVMPGAKREVPPA